MKKRNNASTHMLRFSAEADTASPSAKGKKKGVRGGWKKHRKGFPKQNKAAQNTGKETHGAALRFQEGKTKAPVRKRAGNRRESVDEA
jgi:hypothetical protein